MKPEIDAKTELESKFNLLEQIEEDPVVTESEWRSELGTNYGQNEKGVRKMTKSEQKAYRLGATGSNSFTMEGAGSGQQLDSESYLSKISEVTPARKELKNQLDDMSLNSEIVNNLPNSGKVFDVNQNINMRTGPLMSPQRFEVDSDFTNSRRIKTQFDGSLGNSSTNFASKLLGLQNASASKDSSRKTDQPALKRFIKAKHIVTKSEATENSVARSNKLKIEAPIEELTVTEFSALRSGYLDKEGLISNSEWTNSVNAKSN